MPRRKSSQDPPGTQRPHLLVPREEAAQQVDERIAVGEALKERARSVSNVEALKTFKADCSRWSDVNAEILRRIFDTDDEVNRYHGGVGFVIGRDLSPSEELAEKLEDVERDIEKLRSVKERLPYIDVARQVVAAAPGRNGDVEAGNGRRVFVVHGHDSAALEGVARFLGSLDLEPVILNEQPNLTRTIIEKFEHHAAGAVFAVVLLTPDDVGGSAKSPDRLSPRARQNVVLELGYFLGAWKRSRVCALYKGGVELPSDLHGVLYVELDDAGAWRLRLAQELDAAGIEIDFNRLRGRR